MENEMLKKIAEKKLQAFATGNMGKAVVSKRKLQEQKQKEDEEAIGKVFQEFFTTFQEAPTNSKVWIRGGTVNGTESGNFKENVYKPIPQMGVKEVSSTQFQECVKIKPVPGNKREIKKSNLELLKEEIKQSQQQRQESVKKVTAISENDFELMMKKDMGKLDFGDLSTTNLYLANLSLNINETILMEIFGKFGPLANVQILRSNQEKTSRLSGFVAFMSRVDSERAFRHLNGKELLGHELKISWGKRIPIPPIPIYIPPAFQELLKPPPASGLPFNAQPQFSDDQIVQVTIPQNRKTLQLIHRMIEFVIREGPLFEAMIMEREINNPAFNFLFDNYSHQHTYYRWKLFSILQGDSQKCWRTDDFRMFENGEIWRPPPMDLYTRGMPEHLIETDPDKSLSAMQRQRFEQLLKNLVPKRLSIGEAMVFAMQHSKASDEVCDMILDAMKSLDVKLVMSCLYLVSDVLSNDGVELKRAVDSRLVEMLSHANQSMMTQNAAVAQGMKKRIDVLLEYWKKFYCAEFVKRLHGIFNLLEEISDEEDGVAFEEMHCFKQASIYVPSKWD